MKRHYVDARVLKYPTIRRFTSAAYRSVRRKAMLHGLLEVDVTRAREILRAHKQATGESLSFTAFLATCLAKAVDEHKVVQGIRLGGKRIVVFDDVDVYTPVEHEVAGDTQVLPHIIRAANQKSFRAIHDEIRAVQAMDVTHRVKGPRFLPPAFYGLYLWLFWRIGNVWPRVVKRDVGTVAITAVGMFGHGAGWGIPIPAPTPLMITVGGIGQKQLVVNGRVEVREYLSLTISVDHDIVDGAPAARFSRRLKELIESGYGLTEIAANQQQERASEEASYVYNS